MGVTVFYGTPSYALRVIEVAEQEGIDPATLGVRKFVFSGEPGASVPSIRSRIATGFGGAEVFDCGNMAEVTPWMSLGAATNEPGMLCWQDIVYTEVCDPVSLTRVPYGCEGTPVYTTLERTSQPMIRLVSGDLTRWEAPVHRPGPDLSVPAARRLRPHRRHVRRAGGEHLPERDRRRSHVRSRVRR
jgi:phenylacetate-CoA ligase